MEWRKQSYLTRLLTLLLSTVAPLTHADAQSFAKVGAVNPETTGTPPGGETRTLTVGANIVVKERIRTSAAGSSQLLFPDQSTLNIGANSDMVIDEYFYDPNAKKGTMVASATKGVLRYVGGQISHTTGVTITTPSAVLGIRGGIVTIMLPVPPNVAALDPSLKGLTGELVINHFGSVTLKNNVSQVTLSPGQATIIGSVNRPIATPFKLSEAALRLITQTQSSRPGQSGGVTNRNVPTNNSVPLPPGFTATFAAPNTAPPPPGASPLGSGSPSIFSNPASSASQTNQVQSVRPAPPHYP